MLFDAGETISESVTTELSDESFGSLSVTVRKPTMQELLEAKSLFRSKGAEFDIYAVGFVSDWSGVIDKDGNPVPFSAGALNAACKKYPRLLYKVHEAAMQVFFPVKEDDAKN